MYYLVCCGKNNSKCCNVRRDEYEKILLVADLHWNAALAPFSLLIQISSATKVTNTGSDEERLGSEPYSPVYLGAVLEPDSWKEANVDVRQKKRAVVKTKGGNSETGPRKCGIQLS